MYLLVEYEITDSKFVSLEELNRIVDLRSKINIEFSFLIWSNEAASLEKNKFR